MPVEAYMNVTCPKGHAAAVPMNLGGSYGRCLDCDTMFLIPQPQAPQVIIVERDSWSPGVAAVLSFLFPGLGQMYKGQIFNGLAWFVITALGYMALVVPGAILHLCCIIGAASGKRSK